MESRSRLPRYTTMQCAMQPGKAVQGKSLVYDQINTYVYYARKRNEGEELMFNSTIKVDEISRLVEWMSWR